MSQLSDDMMGDAEPLTDSQLDTAAQEFLESHPANERLEDGLAIDGVVLPASEFLPASKFQPAQPVQPVGDDADATGKCKSSNGDSTGDEEEEEEGVADLDSLMEAGGKLISRFPDSQSQSQESDGDFEDGKIRLEFDKLSTSVWMQKKLDKTSVELEKFLKQYDQSKRELVKPIKELIVLNPDKKQGMTILSGLLSDACMDSNLRDAIIASAQVLKTQSKIIEFIQTNMKIMQVGGECIESKKSEEAAKRNQSTSMADAEALLAGVKSVKKPRNK
jgi:uncharacterized protein YjbJ (UPF0337 family)